MYDRFNALPMIQLTPRFLPPAQEIHRRLPLQLDDTRWAFRERMLRPRVWDTEARWGRSC